MSAYGTSEKARAPGGKHLLCSREVPAGTEWRMLYKAQTAGSPALELWTKKLGDPSFFLWAGRAEDRPLNAVALGPLSQKQALGAATSADLGKRPLSSLTPSYGEELRTVGLRLRLHLSVQGAFAWSPLVARIA